MIMLVSAFPSTFLLMLSIHVGLSAMLSVASASGLVPRGYEDINPRTMSCTIGFHQSALIGTTLYIDGGYFWYNNGSNHVGPNMWLRVLDLSKNFTVDVVEEIPIQFIDRPAIIPEVSSGSLWAYNGALYQRAGFNEWCDHNFPGWNNFPNGSVFDFWKYDIKANSWGISQHNPNTLDNTPVKRLRHAQSIMIEALNKAFVISGEVDDDGSWANGMLIYDFKKLTWEHKPTNWDKWSKGLVNHVALDDPSGGYIVGFAGQVREAGRMDLIEIYDMKYGYWRQSQPATAADERVAMPGPREHSCSVIARAKDGSSYNIYMFGGWSVDGSTGYNDVWVLSIPSFKWFQVNNGQSGSPGTPPTYEASTCYIVGGGSKMLVYGGRSRVADFQAPCDRTGIHVFDLTNLVWQNVYDPHGEEYKVPKQIYDVIGGGPYGGATLLPKGGMSNSDVEVTFKNIIANATTSGNNATTTGPGSGRPSSGDTMVGNSKSGLSGGAIGGIVAGVVVGISFILLGILWLRRRASAAGGGSGLPGSSGVPPAEMSATLPLGELHPYGFSPQAQELHAYMPNEMASPTNEGQTGASYYEPLKPDQSINGSKLGSGEHIQQSPYYGDGHSGESLQQPYYDGSDGTQQPPYYPGSESGHGQQTYYAGGRDNILQSPNSDGGDDGYHHPYHRS